MTLEIIGFPRSNFVRAVRMVAEEKGVPYELLAEFPHSDTVKDLNPTGKIPAMRHDGLELCESPRHRRVISTTPFDGPKMIPEDVQSGGACEPLDGLCGHRSGPTADAQLCGRIRLP